MKIPEFAVRGIDFERECVVIVPPARGKVSIHAGLTRVKDWRKENALAKEDLAVNQGRLGVIGEIEEERTPYGSSVCMGGAEKSVDIGEKRIAGQEGGWLMVKEKLSVC